jgi:hypothetical protein
MISQHTMQIRPVKPEDLERIVAAAKEDDHAAVAPNFFMRRNGEVVGCMSVGVLPLVFFWMHSKKTTARDSVQAATFFENILAMNGAQNVVVPVPKTSPFHGVMSAGGYAAFGENTLFHKTLE